MKYTFKINKRVIFCEGTLAFIGFPLQQTLSTTKPRNSGFEQIEYSYLPLSKFVIFNIEIEGNKRQETKSKFAIVRFFNTVKPPYNKLQKQVIVNIESKKKNGMRLRQISHL